MHLDPDGTPGFADYEAGRLTQFLATNYPATLVRWTQSRIENAPTAGHLYQALPHAAWQNMYYLPHESKDELWRQFGESVYRIDEYLVGADIPLGEDFLTRRNLPRCECAACQPSGGTCPAGVGSSPLRAARRPAAIGAAMPDRSLAFEP